MIIVSTYYCIDQRTDLPIISQLCVVLLCAVLAVCVFLQVSLCVCIWCELRSQSFIIGAFS